MVGNRPVFGPPPPPSPPRYLIDCDEDENYPDEDLSDGSYVGGPVPFPEERAGGPTLRPRQPDRGGKPPDPPSSSTSNRLARGGQPPPGLTPTVTPVHPGRGAAPQPGSRARAPPPSTSLHPPGQKLAPFTAATPHSSTLASPHPQSSHRAHTGPTGPTAGAPLEASRHAYDGNLTGTGANPLLRRPRGRPLKPGPPLPTTKPPSALDGRPSLVPDRHTMAMRPPSPSPPHSEEDIDEYEHSDIDMDAMDHILATGPPGPHPRETPNPPQSSYQLWQTIRKTQTPQGILISLDDQHRLSTILEQEHVSMIQLAQQQKDFQKKIESFMASLEKKIDNIEIHGNGPLPPPINPPLHFSSNPWNGPINNRILGKRPNPTTSTLPKSTRNDPIPPPVSFLNQFKPSSFIIRKIPDTTPFKGLSSEDITTLVNDVLISLNATTSDDNPIRIKAVAILKSGDIKFFVKTRHMTSWLLTNKHTWTHLCDPLLITRPVVFPVIIHSVPLEFNPESPDLVEDLCLTNNFDSTSITNIRWLGTPSFKPKVHGSLVISFNDRSLASQIEKGGLFYQSHFMRAARYIRGPTQCFNCLEIGHTFKFCKNPPFCNRCGNSHNTKNCQEFETDSVKCHKCIQHHKNQHPETAGNLDTDDLQFRHSSTGALCPRRRKLQRQGTAYL